MKKSNDSTGLSKYKKPAIIGSALAAGLLLSAAGCDSDAAKVNENITTAADQFEVQRKIVGINGITDTPAFEVTGRCSINDQGHQLEVICKHGPDDYRKHFVGISDNVYYVATQLEGINVSEYHTRIIIKPLNIIPEFSLEAGK